MADPLLHLDGESDQRNPTLATHVNGTLVLVYRTNVLGYDAAVATSWHGPWTRIAQHVLAPLCAEDPHIFFDSVHHDVLRMICHGGNNSAVPPTLSGHYFSTNLGRSWTQAGHLPPYSHNFSWANGTYQPLARRERPSMVLDPTSGKPVARK